MKEDSRELGMGQESAKESKGLNEGDWGLCTPCTCGHD